MAPVRRKFPVELVAAEREVRVKTVLASVPER
jgi:hypothetical protein